MTKERNIKPLILYVVLLLILLILNPLLISHRFEIDFINLLVGWYQPDVLYPMLIGLALLYFSQFNTLRIHRFLATLGMILTIPHMIRAIGIFLDNEVLWNHWFGAMLYNSDWLYRFPQSYILYFPISIGASTLYLGLVFRIKKQISSGIGQSVIGVLLLLIIYYYGYSYYVPATYISLLILVSIYLLISVFRFSKEDLQTSTEKI